MIRYILFDSTQPSEPVWTCIFHHLGIAKGQGCVSGLAMDHGSVLMICPLAVASESLQSLTREHNYS